MALVYGSGAAAQEIRATEKAPAESPSYSRKIAWRLRDFSIALRLEHNFSAELKLPRIELAKHAAERRIVQDSPDHAVIRMISDIECLGSQLQAEAFFNVKGLDQDEIKIDQSGSDYSVPAEVAEGEVGGRGKSGGVEPITGALLGAA